MMKSDPPEGGGALIVTGFHRSGTSAAARLLHRGGVFLGDRLIGARASNPFGHFEDLEIVGLHDRLLGRNGLTWQTDHAGPVDAGDEGRAAMAEIAGRRAPHGIWGFKDPRACFFLDDWWRAVPTAKVIGVVRHPSGAAASLLRRESRLARSLGGGPSGLAADPGHAFRMWIAANRLLADAARRRPGAVLLVSFSRLRAGAPLLSEVRRRWGMEVQTLPTAAAVEPAFPAGPPRGLRTDPALAAEAANAWDEVMELEQETWRAREAAGA
jgi:hypothetical protein